MLGEWDQDHVPFIKNNTTLQYSLTNTGHFESVTDSSEIPDK